VEEVVARLGAASEITGSTTAPESAAMISTLVVGAGRRLTDACLSPNSASAERPQCEHATDPWVVGQGPAQGRGLPRCTRRLTGRTRTSTR
jgi:hypothetical protein